MSIGTNTINIGINRINEVIFPQSTWVHTQNKEAQLETRGVGPCHVLIGYHQSTQMRFIAHITDSNHPDSIKKIFECMKETYPIIKKEGLSSLDVHLIGGWKSHPESERWGQHIKRILQDYKIKPRIEHFQIKNCEITFRDNEKYCTQFLNTDYISAVIMPPLSKQINDEQIDSFQVNWQSKATNVWKQDNRFLDEVESLENANEPLILIPGPQPTPESETVPPHPINYNCQFAWQRSEKKPTPPSANCPSIPRSKKVG